MAAVLGSGRPRVLKDTTAVFGSTQSNVDLAMTGGRKMELGANWIHGILGNPIYELASTHGLVDIIQENKPHSVVATLPDGRRVPFHILQVGAARGRGC